MGTVRVDLVIRPERKYVFVLLTSSFISPSLEHKRLPALPFNQKSVCCLLQRQQVYKRLAIYPHALPADLVMICIKVLQKLEEDGKEFLPLPSQPLSNSRMLDNHVNRRFLSNLLHLLQALSFPLLNDQQAVGLPAPQIFHRLPTFCEPHLVVFASIAIDLTISAATERLFT